MNTSPIEIRSIVRRLKGGSQAQLIQAENDLYYVAKLGGNPQGNRTLVNEWIAASLLSYINVSTPPARILELVPTLANREDLHFVLTNRRKQPEGRFHFGSQCPVNPETTAIFDFLPSQLLSKVDNLREYATMYVFDRWLGHVDKRQAIFTRDRSLAAAGPILKAYFIDNGMVFSGVDWAFHEAPHHGLAFQKEIYSMLDMDALVEDAICQIESIDSEMLWRAVDGVPSSWFSAGDRDSLCVLLAQLQRRQVILRPTIERQLAALWTDGGPS